MRIFRYTILMACMAMMMMAQAQQRLIYTTPQSEGGAEKTVVHRVGGQLRIGDAETSETPKVPGIATHYVYVDYDRDTVITQLYYASDEQYFSGRRLQTRNEYTREGNEKIGKYNCEKYTIVLFSNKIELWVTQDLNFRATPVSGFGDLPGVLVRYVRNGSEIIRLESVEKEKMSAPLFPSSFGTPKSAMELNQLEKEKLVLTTPVFEDAQICFDPSIAKPVGFPYDSVLRFANGTVILKHLKMPRLPEHYQLFAELTEYSNGDAYDRTGSIFIIPASELSLLQALADSVQLLPWIEDRAGERYHGMVKTDKYLPPAELVRFFTPFGVRHYNEYRSLPGESWADKVYYKQDITDFRTMLADDVYIGAFIGNYDKGGHKVSLTIKAYPESDAWTFDEAHAVRVTPLFNTCNVMEMAGQNYGRLFGTDSLTVTFTVSEGMEQLTLRYQTTGHGGWDNGDEFVPKTNTILVDGHPRFIYTPWRCDCGTYRTSNPASGNFWNGLSSSDYSRSGWCPGTASQPLFIDLSDLPAGEHTMTIAIPQGEPEGGSFSAWSVSGALIEKINNR